MVAAGCGSSSALLNFEALSETLAGMFTLSRRDASVCAPVCAAMHELYFLLITQQMMLHLLDQVIPLRDSQGLSD
jgi:hypothetical protein